MQQVQSKFLPSIFHHHDVSFLGSNGRHDTRHKIQQALDAMENKKTSRGTHLKIIFDLLSKYKSDRGIPSELITEVINFCLSESVEAVHKWTSRDSYSIPAQSDVIPVRSHVIPAFAGIHHTEMTPDFFLSFEIINLITHKFHHKIHLSSEILEHHLFHFCEMISCSNENSLESDDQYRLKIHECLFYLINFHIKYLVDRDRFSTEAEHKAISDVFSCYKDFILKNIQPNIVPHSHLDSHFQSIFESLVKFLKTFDPTLTREKRIFKETTSFLILIIQKYHLFLKSDHVSVIQDLIDFSIEDVFKTKYCLVRNVYIADKFVSFSKGKEPYFVKKLEQNLLSNPILEHFRMPDFNEVVSLYAELLKKCAPEFQLETMKRLLKKYPDMKGFWFFLEKSMSCGLSYKEPLFSQYTCFLKDIAQKVLSEFRSNPIYPESIRFFWACRTLRHLFLIQTEFKKNEDVHVLAIGKLIVEISLIGLSTPKVPVKQREQMVIDLNCFIGKTELDPVKLTTKSLQDILFFAERHGNEPHLIELGKKAKSVLFKRSDMLHQR